MWSDVRCVLRCTGRIWTPLSRTLDRGACSKSSGTYRVLVAGGFVVQFSFLISVSLFPVQSHLTPCWCGINCPSPASGRFSLNPRATYTYFTVATYRFSFTEVLLINLKHFSFVSCRPWYFTSSGAIAWRRRSSEMPSRWTPQPMRSGTAWARCCRLKATMMLRLNASWRRWSWKLAVPWSLLPSFPESFERASPSTSFGLTSGWGNPVYRAAW